MERCPNCRARYHGDEQCRRCGMELTRLLETEQAAQRLQVEALGHLEGGAVPDAIAALEQSLTLCHTPFTAALLDFAQSQDTASESAAGT